MEFARRKTQPIHILRIIAKIMAENSIRDAIISTHDAEGIWDVLKGALTAQSIVKK